MEEQPTSVAVSLDAAMEGAADAVEMDTGVGAPPVPDMHAWLHAIVNPPAAAALGGGGAADDNVTVRKRVQPARVRAKPKDLYVHPNRKAIRKVLMADRKKDLLGELADWKAWAAEDPALASIYVPVLSKGDSYETVVREHARVAAALGVDLSEDDDGEEEVATSAAHGDSLLGGAGGAAADDSDSSSGSDSSSSSSSSSDDDEEEEDEEDGDASDNSDEEMAGFIVKDEEEEEGEEGEVDEDEDEEAEYKPVAKKARTAKK